MKFLKQSMLLICATLVVACAGTKPNIAPPEPGSVDAFDGAERLPDWVEPTGYTLNLQIDPREERFSGRVAIEVDLDRAEASIPLHAGETIKYDKVWVEQDGTRFDAIVARGDNGGITVSVGKELSAGEATLNFRYNAPIGQVPEGLYRVEEDSGWYAFTQFEPLEARTAFPSFDEPRFKTRFDVTMRVPDGMQAFTNTPDISSKARDGQRTWKFVESEPMPTYLVAFAVGNFDVVNAPATAMGEVPFRIITVKGKGDLAAYALEKSPAILAFQEQYFGSDLPYKKLDFVAVPNFSAGAMENIGLVTFRETLLLLDTEGATAGDKYACQSVIAHELAHMWFGNYVTPAWWDDLWLNESFATWMATKTLLDVAPELEAGIDAVRSALRVMSQDALEDARAIRQPIESPGDVYNAFDGITYRKGAAILAMVESWVGEESFRAGIRDYLESNAHGTGTTKELLGALDEATGKDVTGVMRTFIDQPGTPLVDVDYRCSDGDLSVRLGQRRYLPAGSEANADVTWKVPVCMRFGSSDSTGRACVLLEDQMQSFRKDLEQCPDWVYPNAGERGYFHWKLPAEHTSRLVTTHRDELNLREKLAMLSHLSALTEARMIDYSVYLEAVTSMKAQSHRAIVDKTISTMFGVEEIISSQPVDGFDEERLQNAYRVWARDLIAPDARRLGFEPVAGEPAADALMRPDVIRAAAVLGGNESFVEKARDVVDAYFENPRGVDVERLELALDIAPHFGDEALWKRIREGISEAPTPSKRVALIGALGRFQQPGLVERSLAAFEDEDIRAQDAWTLVGPTLEDEETAAVTWTWFQSNFDAIVDKLGEKSTGRMPWLGVAFCSEARRDEVAAFWEDKVDEYPGARRNLSKALESIERCERFRDFARRDAAEFLYAFAGYEVPGGESEGDASGEGSVYEDALDDPDNMLTAPTSRLILSDAKRGGTLNRYFTSRPHSLNWIHENEANTAELQRYIHSQFARQDYGNPDKWTPELAYRVEVSEDRTTYTIHLREGVYWHVPDRPVLKDPQFDWLYEPRELTAEDAVYFFELVKDPVVEAGAIQNYYDDLEGAEVIDRYTFRVTWKKQVHQSESFTLGVYPMPKWLYTRTRDGAKIATDKMNVEFNDHWADDLRLAPGTGPYRLSKFDYQDGITLERNAWYWGEIPPIETIEYDFVYEPRLASLKVRAGELDIARMTPEVYAGQVVEQGDESWVRDEEFEHAEVEGRAYYYLGWNTDGDLFSDKRVRQAMTHALDRKSIIEEQLYGLGTLTTGPFPPEHPGYDNDIAPYNYDLRRARRLLASAGWRDSNGNGIRDKEIDGERMEFRFDMVAYNTPTARNYLGAFEDSLEQIGVVMNVQYVAWSEMQIRMAEGDFDAYTGGWALGWEIDPYQIWHSSQADLPRSSNKVGFRNERADEIIETLRVTFDPDERAELLREFHGVLHEEQPYTFFYVPKFVYAWRSDLQNVTFQKYRPLDLSIPWYFEAD